MSKDVGLVRLNTETDIFYAHELAVWLARHAGATLQEQFHFASRVTDHVSKLHLPQTEPLIFSIRQPSEQFLLTVKQANDTVTSLPVPRDIPDSRLKDRHNPAAKSRRELERGYRDLERITFALSHDLKNSVTKLGLSLELMNPFALPEEQRSLLQIIRRSATNLENTLTSMNQVIRIDHLSDNIVTALSPELIVREVYEELAEAVQQKTIQLHTELKAVAEIQFIETYLRSIFRNLISNSIKYADPSRNLLIHLTARPDETGIHFTYSDNGQGFDAVRHSDKLFTPFSRFSSDTTEGSGIGLYLIRSIIERDGGKITVESVPGKGTTFHFTLVTPRGEQPSF
ncbi:sensor histidine kinase [Terrimonas ferruginea]|uniref:sensor histidine kinase n=1 Tax=Terrimonas ferruginea TaxID=249 RepID=UPI0003FF6758|nr:HAMP domain-containing sensor histidine kinase [Terrimonas ferruginea]